MDIAEIEEKMSHIGCSIDIVKTGHPRFHRGFIRYVDEQDRTITAGRMTIYDGKYDHIKWYCGSSSHPAIMNYDYYIFAWNMIVRRGIVVDKDIWLCCLDDCYEMSKQAKAEKQAARDKLKPKKRRALITPNPRHFMEKAYLNLLQELCSNDKEGFTKYERN